MMKKMENLKGRALALVLAIMLAIGLMGALSANGLAAGLSLSDLLDQIGDGQMNAARSAELPAMMGEAPTQEMLDAAAQVVESQLAGRGEMPSIQALGYVQGSEILRARVLSVRFEDSLAGAPGDAWDVSAAGDGSVLAWAELRDDFYYITFAGEGGVALSDPMGMFCNYINLQELDFNGCVDSSAATDMSMMFYGCMLAKDLDLRDLDTSNVTNMSGMFSLCILLERLNLESFDTSRVEDMRKMFYATISLEEIQTGPGFAIGAGANVEDMFNQSAFTMEQLTSAISGSASAGSGAGKRSTVESILMADEYTTSELNSPDIDQFFVLGSDITRESVRSIRFVDSMNGAPQDAWDASQAGDGSVLAWVEPNGELYDLTIAGNGKIALSGGSGLFSEYKSLEEIDFNGCVDTSAVSNMRNMFYACESLTSLDLSGFDTANVTDMNCMFFACISLTSLDLSGFNTANVTDMNSMFYSCRSLASLDVSGFDTSNVTDMGAMFWLCDALESLDVSGFNTANATNMELMFDLCESLESLDVSGFDTANVTDMRSMFNGCASLKSLDVSGFEMANVTDMSCMFDGCASLTSLDVSGFDTANATSMRWMFSGCTGLTSLDLSNFDTRNVTDMSGMFSGCSNLAELNIRNFDTRNVTDMSSMFWGTKSLPDVKVGENFIVGSDVKRDDMFEGSMLIE